MSQALVIPCRAPSARLYSGRLVHPGTPQAQAGTGAKLNNRVKPAQPLLNDTPILPRRRPEPQGPVVGQRADPRDRFAGPDRYTAI